MIFQQQDTFGRWQVLGFGEVVKTKDDMPVKTYEYKEFVVTSCPIKVAATKAENGRWVYQTINVVNYARKSNKKIFETMKTLQPRQRVVFGGLVSTKKYIDKETNREVETKEVYLNFIYPVDALEKFLCGFDSKFDNLYDQKGKDKAVKVANNKRKKKIDDLPF